MKTLFKAVALITIFSILTRIAGFFFRIYLARALGEVQLGIYTIAFSVFIVLLTIVSSGLPLTVSKLTARNKVINNDSGQCSMVSASLIVGGLSAILLCIIVVVFNKYLTLLFPDTSCIYILISLLPAVVFSSAYAVLRGVLWGQNRYLVVCLAEFLEQFSRIIICVIGLSLLFTSIQGSLIAGLSLSIACGLSFLFVLIVYFRNGNRLGKPTKSAYKEVLAPSASITGVRVLSSLLQPIVALLVPMRMISAGFTSDQTLMLFGIAMGMTYPLLFLPSTLVGSLAMALLPDLASAQACNDQNKMNTRIQTSLIFSVFVACLCLPAYAGLGEGICLFLFDNAQAGIFLQNASWIMIPICVNTISTTILNALGLEAKSLKNYIYGAIFMLIALWFLPEYIGVECIIVGLGGCMIISTLLNLNMVEHTLPKLHYRAKSIFLILVTIPSIMLTSNIYGILSMYLSNFLSLLICGTLSVAIFVLLCQVFDIVKINSLIKIKKTE